MVQQESGAGRLFFPGLADFYARVTPWGYPLIRFIAGAILFYHGFAKLFFGFAPFVAKNVLTPMGFPIPLELTYFLAILESVGGVSLALGLFVRPIALMLVVEFVFITIWHFPNGYFFTAQRGGYEYGLLLTLVYLGIFFRGAGPYSLDHKIGKEF
jgi:putative oxidoreductase